MAVGTQCINYLLQIIQCLFERIILYICSYYHINNKLIRSDERNWTIDLSTDGLINIFVSVRMGFFFLFVYFSSPKATSSIIWNGWMFLQVLIPHPLSSPPLVQDACESFNQPALSCSRTERAKCSKKISCIYNAIRTKASYYSTNNNDRAGGGHFLIFLLQLLNMKNCYLCIHIF